VAVLKGRDFQQQHLVKAFIRPSHPDVSADPALVNDTVAELSFPNQLSVIDAVLQSYQNQLRRPTTAIYVLDVSGSMDGQRMMDMKEAMNRLTQHKSSTISERLLAFHERETVILLPFSGEVYPSQRFDFSSKESVAKQSAAIQQVIASLDTRGGTAIYSALDKAYELALSEAKLQPNNLITIVLLTDGENNEGMSLLDWFNKRDRATHQANITIRTFPIVFGEANPDEMQQVAVATGGKVFEGRQDNLAKVFREIRGYQ
jgi:Ca-activated chloride channel family protein